MSKGKKKAPARRDGTTGRKDTVHALSPDRPVVALAAIGMALTAYLTILSWTDGPAAFCVADSGCDVIRQSRWSTLFGLPVALWGFSVYALLALMAWRLPARLKRWRRLWLLSLAGLAISLYLTVVGIVALDAVCPWCLASLATITTVFIVLTVRRPDSAPGMAWPQWLMRSGGGAIVVVALLHISYSGLPAHPDTPKLEALAIHLEESGARYYGAWWCPSCQEQKRVFRGAADLLPFVECSTGGRGSPMTLHCRELGIDAYPTWIIGGRRYTGVVPPAELARYAGFDWE